MDNILIYFFMALGLSMDAFSLAIAYGTNSMSEKKSIILSASVGIFHFIMPTLGNIIGNSYFQKLVIHSNIVVGIIFLLLSIEMILSLKEEKEVVITNLLSIILFSFTVSIDSFSVGIALGITNSNILISSTIFAITSFIFTILGLSIGKYLSKQFGKKATIFGIIILLYLSIKYFLSI